MTAVAVLAVDRVIATLGRLELQQKGLGMFSHAHGVRLAITAIQDEDQWLLEPPPVAASPFAGMVAALTRSPST